VKIRRIVSVLAVAVLAALSITGTAHAAGPAKGLMWFSHESGELSTWQLNGSGTVLGKQALNLTCGVDCWQTWRPLGTADFNGDGKPDLLWWNQPTGELSVWLTDGNGTVTGFQSVDWRCDNASNCAWDWTPFGFADFNGDGHVDIMWWNHSTGVLSAWLLNGQGTVLGKQDLDRGCGSDGCRNSHDSIGVGDMNDDGHPDLVFWHTSTGEVESWLLNGAGHVIGVQNLDWRCGSDCRGWGPRGVADLNGDGHQDVLWHDPDSGVLSGWLTNGRGTVVGKQDLDWTCDRGCLQHWDLVDPVR
jgi:hypothetical protein